MQYKWIITVIIILALGGGWHYRHNLNLWWQQQQLPPAVYRQTGNGLNNVEVQANLELAEQAEPDNLPLQINLAVPFMVQAPQANWSLPYQEACEEAALIMAHYYKLKKELDPVLADQEIQKLVDWQNIHRDDYKDTTIAETAAIAEEYWGDKAKIINHPTIDMIKQELAHGYPVIAPFYGRALGNQYYSGDGPLYHMLVIKGYFDDKFITNDPGTKRGADYVYDADIIMRAMHDWNGGQVETGQAVIFVLK
ncbi:MAG: C39 family peptidase [Candidatus Komeilibacteria bacterium]